MDYREAVASLAAKFRSGNDVPVPQTTITREEWEALRRRAGDYPTYPELVLRIADEQEAHQIAVRGYANVALDGYVRARLEAIDEYREFLVGRDEDAGTCSEVKA